MGVGLASFSARVLYIAERTASASESRARRAASIGAAAAVELTRAVPRLSGSVVSCSQPAVVSPRRPSWPCEHSVRTQAGGGLPAPQMPAGAAVCSRELRGKLRASCWGGSEGKWQRAAARLNQDLDGLAIPQVRVGDRAQDLVADLRQHLHGAAQDGAHLRRRHALPCQPTASALSG